MSPATMAAVRQLVEWAEAYVEKGALMLIDLMREQA